MTLRGDALASAEAAVLRALDEDDLTQILRALVAVPSLPGQEEPAQDLVATLLADAGTDVERYALDVETCRAHPAFSSEFDRASPTGVRGAVGDGTVGDGTGARTLLLNGHTDVVPPGDAGGWSHDPFEPTTIGRRLYGRGACDMKGGLAAAIAVAKAVTSAGVPLSGRLVIDAVVGEEDGGIGTLGALLHGTAADAAIVLEPTRLAVSPAVAGALTFRISIAGKSAHGCLREEGVSAIEKMPIVTAALLELERERNQRDADPLFSWLERPFAICTGRVEGGDWASSEADWLRLDGRYGIAPGEDLEAARQDLEAAVSRAAASDPWLAEHPPDIAWVGAQFLPGRCPVDDPVVATLADAVRDTSGAPPELVGQPYGCDMGLLTRVGRIPTVVFGPGDIRQAHTVDEWVDLDEVVRCARALAVAAVRFCA